jgi:ADP-heptose:LPS heptosyltransferase
MKQPERIIISRTDSIGDVVLTLPLAGALKARFPDCHIIFLGRDYTKDVVALSPYVDEFLSWDDIDKLDDSQKKDVFQKVNADTIIHVFPKLDIAKLSARAGIPQRIGTTGRIYHYRYCNKLVPFSRKNSDLHEAQLNFKLLKPLIGEVIPSFEQIEDYYGFKVEGQLQKKWASLIDNTRFNLILHPKSKGSAREWPLENYTELIGLLPLNKYKIFISGTQHESKLMESFLEKNKTKVTDLTGKFTLDEFILFISQADGLVAASTGPLHIAAALGKLSIGIYPPIKPMHPGRWAPIGKNAHYLVVGKECNDCRKTLDCHCMGEVKAEQVAKLIMDHAGER